VTSSLLNEDIKDKEAVFDVTLPEAAFISNFSLQVYSQSVYMSNTYAIIKACNRHAVEAEDIHLRSVIRVSNPSQSAVENLCYPRILLDIHAIIIYIFIRELDTLFLICL
jgi:hypothetical protein